MQNKILNESFQIEQNKTKKKGKIETNFKNNSNKILKITCLKNKWKGHNMNEICWVFFCVNVKQ
jgi:hypothetical protein